MLSSSLRLLDPHREHATIHLGDWPASPRLGSLMQLAAPHQMPGNLGRLKRREIAGDRDEDAPAFIRVAPDGELRDPRLQHLVGVEARVFPKHRARVAISACGG